MRLAERFQIGGEKLVQIRRAAGGVCSGKLDAGCQGCESGGGKEAYGEGQRAPRTLFGGPIGCSQIRRRNKFHTEQVRGREALAVLSVGHSIVYAGCKQSPR